MGGWGAGNMRSSVVAVVVALGAPALAGDWVVYVNDTSARIDAPLSLVVNDNQEKDYAWGDVDKDGDIDLVIVRKEPFTTPGRRVNVLLMNEGGVLVDRTAAYASDADVAGDHGFGTPTNDRDVVLVDVDGDTWLDMITAVTISDGLPEHIGHPRVYMNKGAVDGVWQGFRFEDARIPQMLSASGNIANPRFCSVSAGDVTGDGAPDLYFGDYDSGGTDSPPPPGTDFNNKLLINDGAGFFTDESELRMTSQMLDSAFGASSAIVDMNDDGVLDVVKQTSLNAPLHVAITYNDPADEGFFNVYDIVYPSLAPYFISVGDLNNDDRLDIVVTDDGIDRYLLNQGNGGDGLANFTQVTFPASTNGFGGNSVVADLDNDGWQDVIITDVDVDIPGCARTSDILRNLGGTPGGMVSFQDDSGTIPSSMLTGIHDVAVFDINNDGWLDLVIGRCNGTQVWMNVPPVSVTFSYPAGIPTFVPPGETLAFQVRLEALGGVLVAESAALHVSVNGGPPVETALEPLGGDLFLATLPAGACGDAYGFHISVEVQGGLVFTDPPNAPADAFHAMVALGTEVVFEDDMEGDVSAWTVFADATLVGGHWEQADPNGTVFNGAPAAPDADATPGAGNVRAFVTENGAAGGAAFASDVDGGPAWLVSPAIDLAGTDAVISYAQWFFTALGAMDVFTVSVSNDGGDTWVVVDTVTGTGGFWEDASFVVGDFVTPTSAVVVRFSTTDSPNDSITEAGVDDFVVSRLICGEETPAIIGAMPPNNARDARQPFEPDGSNPDGWQGVTLTMDGDASGLTASDFVVTHTGDGPPPGIIKATPDGNTIALSFDTSIAVLAWTTVTHVESGTSTRLGYLPADVNEDGVSNANDILVLIDALNNVGGPLPAYKTDIDRSGAANASDILREIDLLNGAGAYDVFLGATLP